MLQSISRFLLFPIVLVAAAASVAHALFPIVAFSCLMRALLPIVATQCCLLLLSKIL